MTTCSCNPFAIYRKFWFFKFELETQKSLISPELPNMVNNKGDLIIIFISTPLSSDKNEDLNVQSFISFSTASSVGDIHQ